MASKNEQVKTDRLSAINVPMLSHEMGESFTAFLNQIPAYLWVEDFSAFVQFFQSEMAAWKEQNLSAEPTVAERISEAMQHEELKPLVTHWNRQAQRLSRAAVKSEFETHSLVARAYEGLLREILFEIVQGRKDFAKHCYWKIFDELESLRLAVHVERSEDGSQCQVYLAGFDVEPDQNSPTDRLIRQNALLFDVSQAILTETSLSKFLVRTSKMMQDHFQAYMVIIALVDVPRREITHAILNGNELDRSEISQELPDEVYWQGLSGWTIRTGETVYSPKNMPDFRETSLSSKRREILEIGSVVVVPIISHPNVQGTLTVMHSNDQENMNKHDIHIATTIANQIAIGLQHFELQERTMRMVNTDLTTNLHNRQYFMHLLENEFQTVRSGGFPIGIFIVDIDHFTKLVEKHGESVAADVLTQMGDRLRESMQNRMGQLGRLDTDIFCVMCKIYDHEALREIAEETRLAISQRPFNSGPLVLKVTVSIGICHINDLGSKISLRECMATANQMLMMAKNNGRNQVYPPANS